MKKNLKNYLIPNKANAHAPHILRKRASFVVVLLALLLFGISLFGGTLIRNGEHFLAAILPSVLADLANEDRVQNGIGTLSVSPALQEAARLKAEDMATRGYFSHVAPNGTTPWHWFDVAGYRFSAAGENLAINFSDSTDVERAWMNSPSHRANLLNGTFTEVGIASATGTFQGQETIFVVQLFGTPLSTEGTVAGTLSARDEPRAGDVVAPAATEIIFQDDLSIVVAQIPEDVGDREVAPVVTDGSAQSNVFERIVTQPGTTVRMIYLLLGGLVGLVLLLSIFIQIRTQNREVILYGLILIAIILTLFFLNQELLTEGLMVV